MSSICILTDSAAQFPQPGFAGRSDVRVLPYQVEFNGQLYEDGQEFRASDLPASANDAQHPRLLPPSVDAFHEAYLRLSGQYSDVLAILTSSHLTSICQNAQAAAERVRGRLRVTVMDSQSISIGLGLLVQAAAEAVAAREPVVEVERMVRSMIPHTYMMLCTPGMSYLHYAGFLDSSQAFVSEMLNLMPIFTLEEGRISSVEKVRNTRSLMDFMQEFLCEFEDLTHIAFLQSTAAMTHEARAMREHAQTCFPQVPFSEHTLNLPLAALVGPHSIGLVVVEKPE